MTNSKNAPAPSEIAFTSLASVKGSYVEALKSRKSTPA